MRQTRQFGPVVQHIPVFAFVPEDVAVHHFPVGPLAVESNRVQRGVGVAQDALPKVVETEPKLLVVGAKAPIAHQGPRRIPRPGHGF